MKQASLPTWSARISDLPPAGRVLAISADEGERQAIAAAHGVEGIESFEAQLLLQPFRRGGARVSGELKVRLTQLCVVSLRPVEEQIDEEFARSFLPPESVASSKPGRPGALPDVIEIIVDPDEEDPPEQLLGGVVDLAAVLLEQFALALNPYPRHLEAALKEADEPGKAILQDSPFASLRGSRGGDPEKPE